MVSLNQITGRSKSRFQEEIRQSFSRNGLENALILALDERGEILEWAADINGVTVPAFAGYAPEGTRNIQLWAWQDDLRFNQAQQYSVTRVGPRIPFLPQPAILDPLPLLPPTAFRSRLPRPRFSPSQPASVEVRYQCLYCSVHSEFSAPVIAHIIAEHPGQQIPTIGELQQT